MSSDFVSQSAFRSPTLFIITSSKDIAIDLLTVVTYGFRDIKKLVSKFITTKQLLIYISEDVSNFYSYQGTALYKLYPLSVSLSVCLSVEVACPRPNTL